MYVPYTIGFFFHLFSFTIYFTFNFLQHDASLSFWGPRLHFHGRFHSWWQTEPGAEHGSIVRGTNTNTPPELQQKMETATSIASSVSGYSGDVLSPVRLERPATNGQFLHIAPLNYREKARFGLSGS